MGRWFPVMPAVQLRPGLSTSSSLTALTQKLSISPEARCPSPPPAAGSAELQTSASTAASAAHRRHTDPQAASSGHEARLLFRQLQLQLLLHLARN